MLESGRLDIIAITDHDRIDFAQAVHDTLGGKIIVGEEITTTEGELIGLYLQRLVPPGLSALETAKHIRAQGGLVYVPHPFETVRKGVSADTLAHIAPFVDIVESYNGRSMQRQGTQARSWSAVHGVAQAASSDAHGWYGWGNTYCQVQVQVDVSSLISQLHHARLYMRSTGLRGRLYPTLNRLRGNNAS